MVKKKYKAKLLDKYSVTQKPANKAKPTKFAANKYSYKPILGNNEAKPKAMRRIDPRKAQENQEVFEKSNQKSKEKYKNNFVTKIPRLNIEKVHNYQVSCAKCNEICLKIMNLIFSIDKFYISY